MKHNEVKAYFKKQLVEALPKYDVLSIDETLSSRNIYIIDKQTKATLFYLDCWFGTNDFRIRLFDVPDANAEFKINKYTDYIAQANGSYYQLLFLGNMINTIIEKLGDLYEVKQSK